MAGYGHARGQHFKKPVQDMRTNLCDTGRLDFFLFGSHTTHTRCPRTFLVGHMDSMIADFHKQYILKFVKPYRRLRVSFLANALKISEQKV